MTFGDPLTVLCWHVHGGWTDSFVRGPHRYLLPTTGPDDPWARGRCGRRWPRTEEVPVDRLGRTSVDLMVLQRPEEIELARRWTGRMPGVDVPAVYVEHNTPTGHAARTRHPLADQDRIPVVHVTGFNALMWDCGRAPTTVIAHGVADPGYRYRGELPHAAVVSNEPVRRARIVGADLIGGFAETAPVDVFGMGLDGLAETAGAQPDRLHLAGDLPTERLHTELGRRRVYLHLTRWTSLGLSLIEAMMLGMPVVALGTTEAPWAVPPEAGLVATDPAALHAGLAALIDDPERARRMGEAGRAHALHAFGLGRFLTDWDRVLTAAVAGDPVDRVAGGGRTGTDPARRPGAPEVA